MDSDEHSTDDSVKRKRDTVCQKEGFIKSKRTARTPTKSEQRDEDKLDLILKLMNELQVDVKTIKNESREFRDELKNLKIEHDELKKENLGIKHENKEIKKELVEMKNKIEFLEKEKRENNLVLSGLTIDSNEPAIVKQSVENFINESLDIKTNISKVYKLGERTYLIQAKNIDEKMQIMKHKPKLKLLKDQKIFINNDLTVKEREKQKQIRKRAQEEKQKGKTIKIGYNKLLIDGIEWRWNKTKEALEMEISKN